MKLASFIAGGKASFGVVTADGVIVLNGRLKSGANTLREALEAGALDEIRGVAKGAKPDHKLSDITFPPGHSRPAENPLRRHQLSLARRRGRPRIAEAAEHVHPLHRHAGRPRRRDDPAEALGQFRLRGRVHRGDRQGRPRHPDRARARSRRRLHLLRRRQRARLSEVFGHVGQELARHRPARAVARHHGRNPRSDQAHADDAAQRPAGAAFRHRPDDLFGAADHLVLLAISPCSIPAT